MTREERYALACGKSMKQLAKAFVKFTQEHPQLASAKITALRDGTEELNVIFKNTTGVFTLHLPTSAGYQDLHKLADRVEDCLAELPREQAHQQKQLNIAIEKAYVQAAKAQPRGIDF